MIKPRYSLWIIAAAICTALGMVSLRLFDRPSTEQDFGEAVVTPALQSPMERKTADDPTLLAGRQFYNDPNRAVVQAAEAAAAAGKVADADILRVLANQPEAIWLNGPTESDPTAEQDIATVVRTSTAAAALNQVALYQIYAIPNRDACAAYSKGGFATAAAYHEWLQRISAAVQGDAVFNLEADAIAQTVIGGCVSPAQAAERYQTLRTAVTILTAQPKVLAVYLDAGHPEWIADPTQLVGALQASGVELARGVVVNVSNFVATDAVVPWVQQLTALLGPNKRAIIDTSRNGNGTPGPEVTDEARWCNPVGRAIGAFPTTTALPAAIDAYVWVKHVGESDGSCGGRPAAGTFMPDVAIELVTNARR